MGAAFVGRDIPFLALAAVGQLYPRIWRITRMEDVQKTLRAAAKTLTENATAGGQNLPGGRKNTLMSWRAQVLCAAARDMARG